VPTTASASMVEMIGAVLRTGMRIADICEVVTPDELVP
jgi:hypothetical protein